MPITLQNVTDLVRSFETRSSCEITLQLKFCPDKVIEATATLINPARVRGNVFTATGLWLEPTLLSLFRYLEDYVADNGRTIAAIEARAGV